MIRFFVSLAAGAFIGVVGFYAAASGPGASSLTPAISFLLIAPIVVPIVGAAVYFAILSSGPDSLRERGNKAGTVMFGLLLGMIGGLFLGFGG